MTFSALKLTVRPSCCAGLLKPPTATHKSASAVMARRCLCALLMVLSSAVSVSGSQKLPCVSYGGAHRQRHRQQGLLRRVSCSDMMRLSMTASSTTKQGFRFFELLFCFLILFVIITHINKNYTTSPTIDNCRNGKFRRQYETRILRSLAIKYAFQQSSNFLATCLEPSGTSDRRTKCAAGDRGLNTPSQVAMEVIRRANRYAWLRCARFGRDGL